MENKEIKKTISQWAFEQNIRLLDEKYYEYKDLYTFEEYRKIVPRDIEVPLSNETWEEYENRNLEGELVIKVSNGLYELNKFASQKIAEFEKAIKEIKAKEDELKANILSEMESKGIIKLDTPELAITYVAPSDRETFDSKSFKSEHQDLYDEYVKISPVKASIRLKVK